MDQISEEMTSFDITMCPGCDCGLRDKCHRYKKGQEAATLGLHYVSFFDMPPFQRMNGKWECKFHWGSLRDYRDYEKKENLDR